MKCLLHEKLACDCLFVGMFSFVCMMNNGNMAIFFMMFFNILLVYLDRLVVI